MIYTLENDSLSIKVNSLGAELQSLFHKTTNTELLWQANKDFWPRHAPVLFPIIGRLNNDTLRNGDNSYPITQHGFARDSEFDLLSQTEASLQLQLISNKKTKKHFPYDFKLVLKYSLNDDDLDCSFIVNNPSKSTLPFSIGGHPAFNWPLVPGLIKEEHRIIFEKPEANTVSQLESGLIRTDEAPSPVHDKILSLKEDLFANDALIFKRTNSKKIRYEALKNDSVSGFIEMEFKDFSDLGIWTKPGADFVCLEPWNGYSSDVDFSGDFATKPGVILLPGESTQSFTFSIKAKIN